MRKKAFTLAEVLITLGIIGVVAEMTIPILMSSVKNQQYISGLEKAYSAFNQTLVQIASDNGCTGDLKCTGLFSYDADSYDAGADDYLIKANNQTIGNEIVKYYKVAKNCQSNNDGGPAISGCFPDKVSAYYTGSPRFPGWDEAGRYRILTADGMSLSLSDYANNCEGNESTDGRNGLTQVCGDVYIDVNGLKGPNNLGRDIFYFLITNGKGPLLFSYGASGDIYGGWKTNGSLTSCYPGQTYGGTCAGRIQEEGWQMKY